MGLPKFGCKAVGSIGYEIGAACSLRLIAPDVAQIEPMADFRESAERPFVEWRPAGRSHRAEPSVQNDYSVCSPGGPRRGELRVPPTTDPTACKPKCSGTCRWGQAATPPVEGGLHAPSLDEEAGMGVGLSSRDASLTDCLAGPLVAQGEIRYPRRSPGLSKHWALWICRCSWRG